MSSRLFWYIVITAAFLGLANNLVAQRFIQLERSYNLKTNRFYIGEELTFRIGEHWYTRPIKDILVEDQIMLVEEGLVKIDDITQVRTFGGDGPSQAISIGLYSFGFGWGIFSVADALAGGELKWSAAIISGGSVATGFLIRQIFKQKTHKLGKRKRLRPLDLSF